MSQENNEPKVVPVITSSSAEDAPFASADPFAKEMDKKLNTSENIDDEIKRAKHQTGRVVLYVAMGVMVLMVILSLCSGEKSLVEGAFEAFKLIAMTVLGFIFASENSKK